MGRGTANVPAETPACLTRCLLLGADGLDQVGAGVSQGDAPNPEILQLQH